MKLFYSTTSPYVRKCQVLAIEAGIIERIETVAQSATPTSPSESVSAANPLGKIPVLTLDDGTTLYDSRVICQYLDTQHDRAPFYPVETPARHIEMTREATADGVLDAAVLLRYEQVLRNENERSAAWIEGQRNKILRTLAVMDRDIAERDGSTDNPSIGDIATGVALGYIDFRNPEIDWRNHHLHLAGWYEAFGQRASMRATVPS